MFERIDANAQPQNTKARQNIGVNTNYVDATIQKWLALHVNQGGGNWLKRVQNDDFPKLVRDSVDMSRDQLHGRIQLKFDYG